VKELLHIYETHEESPLQSVKYNTRKTYEQSIRIIRKTIGDCRLETLNGIFFKRWHRSLLEPREPGQRPRINSGHRTVTTFKLAVRFGCVLEIRECQRLDGILSKMRFAAPAARTTFLAYDQARAIIKAAHDAGRPSIALAQALQFELTLRQKDVIGEWLPDPAAPGGRRWANGLTWNHIGPDMILRKRTTKTGAEVAFDLKLYPLVMEELELVPADRRVGPMIISEQTGLAYRSERFSKTWRDIATAAGVPRDVYNMDSRSGGITEAASAGAPLELIRHHATHRDPKMTARYSRPSPEQNNTVAKLRAASRARIFAHQQSSRQNGVRTAPLSIEPPTEKRGGEKVQASVARRLRTPPRAA
jgi:hypothetical protein